MAQGQWKKAACIWLIRPNIPENAGLGMQEIINRLARLFRAMLASWRVQAPPPGPETPPDIRVMAGDPVDREKILAASAAGLCPDCLGGTWIQGPSGGTCTNWTCANPDCGSRFNFCKLPDLTLVERISAPSPLKRPIEGGDAAEIAHFRDAVLAHRCADCGGGLSEVGRGQQGTGACRSIVACRNPACGSRFEIFRVAGLEVVSRQVPPSPRGPRPDRP
jgi:hypothetical protein